MCSTIITFVTMINLFPILVSVVVYTRRILNSDNYKFLLLSRVQKSTKLRQRNGFWRCRCVLSFRRGSMTVIQNDSTKRIGRLVGKEKDRHSLFAFLWNLARPFSVKWCLCLCWATTGAVIKKWDGWASYAQRKRLLSNKWNQEMVGLQLSSFIAFGRKRFLASILLFCSKN